MGWLSDSIRALFSGRKASENSGEKTATASAVPLHTPWTGDMVMEPAGDNGKRAEYPGYSAATMRMRWVSRETGPDGVPLQTRTPEEKTHTFPAVGFVAAGRPYASLDQLTAEQDESGHWRRDVYGREVLCLWERFPCFDSADLLYEDRYFRWFFLRQDGKLIRVQHTDERPTVTVTEDVADLEQDCWRQMEQLGYFSL